MIKNSDAIENSNEFKLRVEEILKQSGYTEVDRKQFFSKTNPLTEPTYAKQVVIGHTIYATSRKCDFILFHPEKFKENLVIECKWQRIKGSVDEKYPFLIQNIRKLDVDTIILLDGGGYKSGAEVWLKEQVGGCIKEIISLSDFSIKADKGLI